MQYLAWPSLYHQFVIFYKNVLKSEPLGVRGYCFQEFHISMIPTTGKNFKKIHAVRVTCSGWFNMELPNEDFFPISNRCYDHCKILLYPFLLQQLSGKHIPSSKSCNLLVQTITEKKESNRWRLLKKNCHKVASCVNY